ncbi:MAG: hypothetical protein VXU46_01795 [Planctomycetota bacterium]|nr:hypothetical protein [Planctomycetota bacterium]
MTYAQPAAENRAFQRLQSDGICFLILRISALLTLTAMNERTGCSRMYQLPSFPSGLLDSDEILSISLIGNVHRRRWRWNPFDKELEMTRVSATRWQMSLPVMGPHQPDVSGCYAVRLIINHSSTKQLKFNPFDSEVEEDLVWSLSQTVDGRGLHNIQFKTTVTQEILFEFDADDMSLKITPSAGEGSITPVTKFSNYQLNGFVWDSLNMFEKFDPRIQGRDFQQKSDILWTIDVPLLKNGGIDFRADGVYQFLISADHEEDFGFSSLNDGRGSLVQGTGFGSSHGTSFHSGCTVRVYEDAVYRFSLKNPMSSSPTVSVEYADKKKASSCKPPELLNDRTSYQLLGSIFEENQFDPTDPAREMHPVAGTSNVGIVAHVKAGFHVVNIGISSELFLDTMGLGCWLDIESSEPQKSLQCTTWHGKPHELNICFVLDKDSSLEFVFDPSTDRLTIDIIEGDAVLKPVSSIDSLSLVGAFDSPMAAWDPTSPLNKMNPLGPGRFEKVLQLEAGKTYNYKYVANASPWALVFADYELDCKGYDFTGFTPNSADPSFRDLKRFGQLTSHGNPPALEFIPTHSGCYRFYADLIIGGYSVLPYQ